LPSDEWVLALPKLFFDEAVAVFDALSATSDVDDEELLLLDRFRQRLRLPLEPVLRLEILESTGLTGILTGLTGLKSRLKRLCSLRL
jgi:hypothetical protein